MRSALSTRLVVPCFAAAAIGTAPIAAQCANTWVPGAAPFDLQVTSSTVWDPDGVGPQPPRLVVGGAFGELGGAVPARVASYDPVAQGWVQVGGGLGVVPSAGEWVYALTTLANGDLVAGGSFTSPVQGLARFDGTSWSAIPGCPIFPVRELKTRANGNLLAGGYGGLAEWDGASWTLIGSFSGSNIVLAVLELPNGDVLAGGQFGGGLARWDGTSWTPGGLPNGVVLALLLHSSGDVIVGGKLFLVAGGGVSLNVVRLTSSGWQGLGSGVGVSYLDNAYVQALAELPDGDVVAGGFFAGGIARYSGGSSWSPFGTGVGGSSPNVYTLTMQPDGPLAVGGQFTTAGGVPSPYLAWIGTTCPAASSVSGSGCRSSGGNNSLAVTSLPWVDATFRAQGTGLPSLAIVFAATSFTAIPQGTLPLASLFAQAPAGCDLLVAPDIVQGYVTTTGSVESSFLLPNTPPIVGLSFFHQLVPIEVDPLGNVVQITATNALHLTAGAF